MPLQKGPQSPPHIPLSLRKKLVTAQLEQEKWKALAENPDLSSAAAASARDMARSAEATVRTYRTAIVYQQELGGNQPGESHLGFR